MSAYRIALVSDWYSPRTGGVELHLKDLAHRLSAAGHDVHVVTSARGGEEAGVRVHRLALPLLRGEIVWPDLRKIADLRRLFERERFDVVHAHGMFSSMAIGSLMAASSIGIPSITTHHSLIDGVRDWIARAVFAIWSRRATLVTAVSAAAARDAARVSGRADVRVLPNGIDIAEWPAATPRAGRLRITAAGRFVRKKGFSDLIDSIPAVLGRLTDPDRVTFTIAGDGPERDRLEAQARALGLGDRIEFPGWLSRDDMRDLLSRSDIFASACRHEAFGVALLEARCSGVPVVAMAGGGVAEVAEDGRTALLARSTSEFADHLVRAADDQGLRDRMRLGSATGHERFDWSRVVPEHIRTYEEATRRLRQPGG